MVEYKFIFFLFFSEFIWIPYMRAIAMKAKNTGFMGEIVLLWIRRA